MGESRLWILGVKDEAEDQRGELRPVWRGVAAFQNAVECFLRGEACRGLESTVSECGGRSESGWFVGGGEAGVIEFL